MAHVLVDRVVFGYDTAIVGLWPEFGAHGKQAATVRHVLTHSVGVPGVPADTTPEDLCNWQEMCEVVADTDPRWEPGTRIAYNAYPFGYIVGEIARRATGKPISQVLREDVAYAYADTATGIAFALTKNKLASGFDAVEQIAEIVTKVVEG